MAMLETKVRNRAKALRGALTPAETALWARLKGGGLGGLKFRRQHPIVGFITDFACVQARLVVEVDGEVHDREHVRASDAARTARLEEAGWSVIRVTNYQVLHHTDHALSSILSAAQSLMINQQLPVRLDLAPSAPSGHLPHPASGTGEEGDGADDRTIQSGS